MNQSNIQTAQLAPAFNTLNTINRVTDSVVVKSYVGVLDLYAESIIGGRTGDYNGIEIQGVCDRSPGDETWCEADNTAPQFFSVYVRLVDGGSEAVGDCEHYSQACEYADQLAMKYGWPIIDAFKSRMLSYLESRTGKMDVELNLVEPFITLSNGRTVFRRMLPNGAKEAFMLDGAFASGAEHAEYWRRMKNHKSSLN
jgi:hypothetical protein